MRAALLAVVGLALLSLLSGCTTVRPWERDALARSDMAWELDPLRASLDSHVRFSKEASLVGGSAGGGGCGCN